MNAPTSPKDAPRSNVNELELSLLPTQENDVQAPLVPRPYGAFPKATFVLPVTTKPLTTNGPVPCVRPATVNVVVVPVPGSVVIKAAWQTTARSPARKP